VRLKTIYGWFTEGFDTADLKEAQILLKKFGGTEHACSHEMNNIAVLEGSMAKRFLPDSEAGVRYGAKGHARYLQSDTPHSSALRLFISLRPRDR
jgi:hypothetical protein